MSSPFPGMDPWLEAPDVWSGLHYRLIHAAVEALLPQLRPRGYFADGGERVWVEESERDVLPDVAVIQQPVASAKKDAGAIALEADEPARVHAWPSEFREPFLEIF